MLVRKPINNADIINCLPDSDRRNYLTEKQRIRKNTKLKVAKISRLQNKGVYKG